METRRMEERTTEDLLEEIRKTASSYVPEWQFDREHPDLGAVLAAVYAQLFEDTLRKFGKVQKKNEIAFFRELGAELLPAVPAKGAVTFRLSTGEFGGVFVPKGFQVLGQGEGEETSQVFETVEDLYVTSASLTHILYENGKEDKIVKVHEADEENSEFSFLLFAPGGKNLQEHVFLFRQEHVLLVEGEAFIIVKPVFYRFGTDSEEEINFLAEKTVFEYYTEDGFVPFLEQSAEKGYIRLHKGAEQPPLVKGNFFEGEGYYIRCRYEGVYHRNPLRIEDFFLSAEAENLVPDLIQTDEGEQEAGDIYPFGQRPSLFSELYIASDEAFSKKGARITVSFRLDFEKYPMEPVTDQQERQWKLVMKRWDFQPNPEYDITIEQVIFEYYNGTGWCRLFGSKENSRIFSGRDSLLGQEVRLEFPCPDDMEPVMLHSVMSRYLRIRVIRMDNLYKIKGSYITPVMGDVKISYSYKGQGLRPEQILSRNNQETLEITGKRLGEPRLSFPLLEGLKEQGASLYLGFSNPLTEGPLRMFVSVKEALSGKLPGLSFEYFGSEGFEPLFVVDETENFRKSGFLTFMGNQNFKQSKVFGVEAYWLRIRDLTGAYAALKGKEQMPTLLGINPNTVRVLAVETMPEEFFDVEQGQKNLVCTLEHENVYDLKVFVDEAGKLTDKELKELHLNLQAESDTDEEGRILHVWVLWKETENLFKEGPGSRCYTVDKNHGQICFGDGRHGMLPPMGGEGKIRVSYRRGGGKASNLKPGSVSQMSRALGFISGVSNEVRTQGGCDQETLKEALRRNSLKLRHGGRAVTASDFEALIREADRNVLKVRCFPGRNEAGSREPGSVTAVVLPQGFQERATQFDEMKEGLMEALKPCIPGNMAALGRFYLTEPCYVRLDCQLEITVSGFHQVFQVRSRIQEKIQEFLDPVTGNYFRKGWEIGQLPNETQIMNVIKGIPGISTLKRLRLNVRSFCREGEFSPETEPRAIYAVPISGAHEIQIQVE